MARTGARVFGAFAYAAAIVAVSALALMVPAAGGGGGGGGMGIMFPALARPRERFEGKGDDVDDDDLDEYCVGRKHDICVAKVPPLSPEPDNVKEDTAKKIVGPKFESHLFT